MDHLHVTDEKTLQELIKHLMNGINIFALIYMNGCSPCNKTKPEWDKIENKWPNTVITKIDKDVIENKTDKDKFNLDIVDGFPTIIHYNKNNKRKYKGKDRFVEDFEKWITESLAADNNKDDKDVKDAKDVKDVKDTKNVKDVKDVTKPTKIFNTFKNWGKGGGKRKSRRNKRKRTNRKRSRSK